jgi:hypothetical protein
VSKISELSDGGSLVSSDYLIAVRSGGNVKVRMDQINVDQVDLGDNEFIRLGNSQDLTMVHTSTQSIINQAGTGDLLIQKAGATKASITANGLEFPDNSKAIFGAGSDLQIYHDGDNSYINDSGVGDLKLGGNQLQLNNAAQTRNYIYAVDEAQVELKYNNALKLATTATGIDVTGYARIGTGTTTPALLTLYPSVSAKGWQISANNYVASALEFTCATANGGTTFTTPSMLLDSSGNLLVGKTALDNSTVGIRMNATGDASFVSDGARPLVLNRKTSDGDIALFLKDGTTVGSIKSVSGVTIGVDGGGARSGLQLNAGSVDPRYNGSGSDNAIDLGRSDSRYKDLYLSGGVYLGGTGAANHLEDYEEGTWTPSYSGAGSPSYLTQYGRYTKIGRVVYCTIAIRATSVSGASNIEIAGLPFTPADAGDTSQRSTYSPFLGGHCSGLSESTGRFRTTATTNLAGVKSSLGTTFMTAAEFSSGGSPEITGDFWYYTS